WGIVSVRYAGAAISGAAIGGVGISMPIIAALGNTPDLIALNGPGIPGIFQLPATIPGQPGWLSAENVPSNVYALAVFCLTGGGPVEPHVFPAVVGGPLDAFAGSAAGSVGGGAPAPAPDGGTGSAGGSGS